MAAPRAPLLGPLPSSAPLQDPNTVTLAKPGSPRKDPKDARVHPVWNAWLSQLTNLVRPLGGNDVTANRPTANLYIGLMFFDTTLGYPVFVKSLNPTVWVNASGGVV